MKKTLVVVLAILGALFLVCIGGMFVGGIWLARNMGPPEGISVQVSQPGAVVSGQTFDLVVTVSNSLPRARTIRDIDLWDALPRGLTLVGTDPSYAEFDPGGGFWTITMEHPVPASGSATVTLTLTAGAAGVYQGDLDVSVDEVLRIHTTPLVITVDPAGPVAPADPPE